MSDSQDTSGDSLVPKELLEILVCPIGKKPLRPEGEHLVCTECGARYHVEEGIPNMVPDEAVLPEGVKSKEELSCWSAEPAASA